VEYAPSVTFGFSRHNAYVDKQTIDTDIIYTVPSGGQYMKIRHNCALANNNYASQFGFGISASGIALVITRLDQIDVVEANLVAGTGIDITNNVISSTGTTYTAGTNIAIDANNVISSPAPATPLSRISYYSRGSSSGITNGITNFYLNSFVTEYNSLSLVYTNQTGTASTGWFLPQGVYKIEYKSCIDQGTYNNRLGAVVNFSFNGVFYISARAFGYSRDTSFIDQQTLNSQFIYTIPSGGQYLSIRHNCNRNTNQYNSVWNDGASINGVSLIITKLD